MKKGFTLIEVLGILVILAVITLIAVPTVNNIIKESKKESFAVNAKFILKQALNEKTRDVELDLSQVNPENMFELLAVAGDNYSSVEFKEYNDRLFINISGTKKWDGLSACGAYENLVVVEGECELDEEAPSIVFNPDGSTEYIKSSRVQVGVTDPFLDEESLKYIWTESEEIPSEEEYTNTFVNSEYIPMPIANGSYYLHVLAKDTLNNTSKVYREFLLDNTAPVISINGDNIISIKKGTVYTDLGATAVDNVDENVIVVTTGTVNPQIVGTYTITYTATDHASNVAKTERTVYVVDKEAPVITILGDNPVNINVGDTYIDAGATAIDDIDGDVTDKIEVIGIINPNMNGEYTITYTVSDNAGNVASMERIVNVIDNIKPTISFGTNGNSIYAKSRSTTVTVSDAHSGIDTNSLRYLWNTSTSTPSEANFVSTFTNGGTINTPGGVTGSYYLWILAKDSVGNTLIARSNAFYLDNTKPVITLNGSNMIDVNAGTAYNDQGAIATDEHSGINGNINITGTVNINLPGIYTVTYNVSDNAGNAALQVTRTINVIDNTAPTVTFGTNGNSTYIKSRSTTVTVSDAHSSVNTSSLKYLWSTVTTGISEASFTTSFTNGATIGTPSDVTGGYYLWILAKDSIGNTLIARSNVFNLDNTKPVITLNGNSSVNVNKGSTYNDLGATATDEHSGINGSISVTGTVNTNVLGTYTITYSVSDKTGNAAIPVTRTIMVVDVQAPVITINGNNPANVYVDDVYTDAGATAMDDGDGNVTNKITATGTVNVNVPGTYYVTYRVKDTANNEATAVRTVNVIDDIGPTVTFGTNGNSSYAQNRSTTVTVSDVHSSINTSSLKYLWSTESTDVSGASITTSFTNGATISSPSSITGIYYLWIFAKDAAGNAIIERSKAFYLDNTAPTISFSSNGNSAYAKSRSTAVSVSDGQSGVASGLKYLWNTSTSTPSEASFTSSFPNGETISSPNGVTGSYYLWIFAKDAVGNKAITRSNVFYLDNTNPTLTLNGSDPSYLTVGSIFSDAGASCSDAHSGIYGGVSATNTIDMNVAGTYSITYSVFDVAGNYVEITRTVIINPYYQYRARSMSTTNQCQTCSSCSTCSSCGTCYETCTSTEYMDAPYCGSGSYCCPSGWSNYMAGACKRTVSEQCNPYSCNCSTYSCNCSNYSCNCSNVTTYGEWSAWGANPYTPSSTLDVQSRSCLNASCTNYYIN